MDKYELADLSWCQRMYRQRVLRASQKYTFAVELWRAQDEREQRTLWRANFDAVVVDIHACYLQFMPYRLGDWLEGIKTFCAHANNK